MSLVMFRPPVNRAMRLLDRSFFVKDVSLSAASILDVRNTSKIRLELEKSRDMLRARAIVPIQPVPGLSKRKCILLQPGVKFDDPSTWSSTLACLKDVGEIDLIPYHLRLTYDHWTAREILEAVLPEELHDETPSGFNAVGHIAHFNLREKYLPYKSLIGELTIDKNPSVETVVNKTEQLDDDNEFRVLDYELLAGKPDTNVRLREGKVLFEFDFAKVFWNSRLGTEHERMLALFKPYEAVCDVMAGVGPFAVPAGKKGVFVWASDLNPHCYEGLKRAIEINKVEQFVTPFCQDGHYFIGESTAQLLKNNRLVKIKSKVSRTATQRDGGVRKGEYRLVELPKVFSHYVMNLPGGAINFLPAFVGIYRGHERLFKPDGPYELPWVHCYCFAPKVHDAGPSHNEVEAEIRWRVSEAMGYEVEIDAREVRRVAPNKSQYCASFQLPRAVAFRA